MNVDTGKIYRNPAEIEEAIRRGERLVKLSDVAHTAHVGMNRKQRRAEKAGDRRGAPRQAPKFKVRK